MPCFWKLSPPTASNWSYILRTWDEVHSDFLTVSVEIFNLYINKQIKLDFFSFLSSVSFPFQHLLKSKGLRPFWCPATRSSLPWRQWGCHVSLLQPPPSDQTSPPLQPISVSLTLFKLVTSCCRSRLFICDPLLQQMIHISWPLPFNDYFSLRKINFPNLFYIDWMLNASNQWLTEMP